jgi:lipopolysaccharide transport system ATP-binding protein
MVAISCEGIGKRYRIGRQERYRTLRDALTELARDPFRRVASLRRSPASASDPKPELWALKDLCLEVKHGEVLGIIGRNGAGKSTLLKILSRITKPTEGRAEIRGRVGSLLEVGAGVHPELTGRENIYLNGSILGMTRREIGRKFDEIVEFSECGRLLDTPMKHYSSGMYVRLAFAVAAHLETEILFIDEVLSVGDVAFQEKCLGRMKEAATGGRTVLFVSHNLLAIQALCQRALWLDQGKVVAEGRPAAVVSDYLKHVRTTTTEVSYEDLAEAPGNDVVRLRRASVRPVSSSDSEGGVTVHTPLLIEFEVWSRKESLRFDCGFNLYNEYGILVLNAGSVDCRSYPAGLIRVSGQIPGDLLNAGVHRVEFIVAQGGTDLILLCPDLLAFEVTDSLALRGAYFGEWPGAVRPSIPWTVESVE